MKKFVLTVLALFEFLLITGCSSNLKDKKYDGGSLDNYFNETVSKDDRIIALNRIKSAFHKKLTEFESNQSKTKGDENSVSISFICEVNVSSVNKEGVETKAVEVINKYDFNADIFYADRIDTQGSEENHYEEWYIREDGKLYHIRKNSEDAITKEEETEGYGLYENIYSQIFEGVEKSLEFDNPDSENFYVDYRYQKGDGTIQFKSEEDELSKNELNWMQKVGYVQSFIKQVEMELYSNGKCYNKLNFIFTEYGTDVNIPDIPEVPET